MRSQDATADRQTILISVCIALVVTAAIVSGLGYLTANVKTNVDSFASTAGHNTKSTGGTSSPVAPVQREGGSRPISAPSAGVAPEADEEESHPSPTPWTQAAAQAYAIEQADRATRLRQEEHNRQLEETRRANQKIIDERTRAQQQRQQVARRSSEQEFTVPLGTFTQVTLAGKSYRVAVDDDGPDEIRVFVDRHPVLHFQKRNGFEGKDIETLILSKGSSHLYYVNEISDHVGHCKLRLRDE